jgi:hypothetical protein
MVVGCVGQAAGGFGAFALKESRTDRSTVAIVTKETSVSVGTASVTCVESAVGRFLLSCLIAFENKGLSALTNVALWTTNKDLVLAIVHWPAFAFDGPSNKVFRCVLYQYIGFIQNILSNQFLSFHYKFNPIHRDLLSTGTWIYRLDNRIVLLIDQLTVMALLWLLLCWLLRITRWSGMI